MARKPKGAGSPAGPPAAPPVPPPPPVLSLERGIRVLSTCFSPAEGHVAFGVLVVGAKWLACHDLATGARTFHAAVHPHSMTHGWTADGLLVALAADPPLRLEAREPNGAVVATFVVPDGSFGDHHEITVSRAGDRILLHAQQRKDDPRYGSSGGGAGYSWVLDARTLAVRHHVDLREHHPPAGQRTWVVSTAELHPTRDDIVFRTYYSSDDLRRQTIEVMRPDGPAVRAELSLGSVVWLDDARLLLYPFDRTELEPRVAPASDPLQSEPIGAWFTPRSVLAIDHAAARVIYHDGATDEVRSIGPDATPRERVELAVPKALQPKGSVAYCLDPASPAPRLLVVYVKNGRTKATPTTPASAFASVLVADSATGVAREALSIARLRPERAADSMPPLEVHASPGGRFVAVVAQEEHKRYLRGYIAVLPR